MCLPDLDDLFFEGDRDHPTKDWEFFSFILQKCHGSP